MTTDIKYVKKQKTKLGFIEIRLTFSEVKLMAKLQTVDKCSQGRDI